jgi:N-acetylglucosamine kinase-like BadF-type ATPase
MEMSETKQIPISRRIFTEKLVPHYKMCDTSNVLKSLYRNTPQVNNFRSLTPQLFRHQHQPWRHLAGNQREFDPR